MEETKYLSYDDVLSYYHETIDQSGGGMSGIREKGGIETILDFVQNDLYYPSFEDKLTYLVYGFCTGHYFADGNKRISLVIGAHFLIKNGRGWAGFHFLPHMEAYIWHVAAGNIDKFTKKKETDAKRLKKRSCQALSWQQTPKKQRLLVSRVQIYNNEWVHSFMELSTHSFIVYH